MGRAVSDIWEDIPPINMQAKERLGYSTQKPVALLEPRGDHDGERLRSIAARRAERVDKMAADQKALFGE